MVQWEVLVDYMVRKEARKDLQMSEGEITGLSELSRERRRKSKVIDRKADGSWNS